MESNETIEMVKNRKLMKKGKWQMYKLKDIKT